MTYATPITIYCRICGAPRQVKAFTDLCEKHRHEQALERQRELRRAAYRPTGNPKGRSVSAWTCLLDPDGDFTGKMFSSVEIEAMARNHSFSPGAVLENAQGKIYRYGGHTLERVMT